MQLCDGGAVRCVSVSCGKQQSFWPFKHLPTAELTCWVELCGSMLHILTVTVDTESVNIHDTLSPLAETERVLKVNFSPL
jgi:hypothetical protein